MITIKGMSLRQVFLTFASCVSFAPGNLCLGAPQPAHWEGPGILMSILTPEENSGLQFKCEADVLRPTQDEPPLVSMDNRLRCVSIDQDNDVNQEWTFGGDTTVSFWGNRYDRKPNFEVKGPFAKYLFTKLGWAFSENRFPGMVSKISACGPGGQLCTDIFALERDLSGDHPSSLLCAADSEDGEVYSVACVFMP